MVPFSRVFPLSQRAEFCSVQFGKANELPPVSAWPVSGCTEPCSVGSYVSLRESLLAFAAQLS